MFHVKQLIIEFNANFTMFHVKHIIYYLSISFKFFVKYCIGRDNGYHGKQ